MITHRPSPARRVRALRAGFTMTELALCIAVVSIALVAIIGVLPTGLNVQRQNREDTIVTEDGKVLLAALRTGAVGSANLLNNFDFILWDRYRVDQSGQPVATASLRRSFRTEYWTDTQKLKDLGYSYNSDPILLTNATQLIALMTAPRYSIVSGVEYLNVVRAQVRAISGSYQEKPIRPYPNPTQSGPDGITLEQRTEFSFRYLVTSEVTPVAISQIGSTPSQALATAQQIRELALTFQWPVVLKADASAVEKLRVGNNRRVYRTQVFGQLMDLNQRDADYLGTSSGQSVGLVHFTPNSL